MTDDTPAETLQSGIAVLAEDEPSWADGPFKVRGVALPEDITPNSGTTEGVQTYWPPDVVESAAAMFEGAKITDGSEHDPETAVENPQPSPDTIVGEVTDARYKPGVGVLYEGEVDDPDLAKRIQRDRLDVSPTTFRSIGDETDDGVHPVTEVHNVRDLSLVAHGSADGNSIEPAGGAAAAMESMAAEALAATFDTPPAETMKSVAGVEFDGTDTGTLDESEIPNDDYENHYLFPADTKSDSSYPVVDADGTLRRGNVESAFDLGARGGVSEEELHDKLRALNDEFEDPPIDPEKLAGGESQAATTGDDGTGAESATQSTDGTAETSASAHAEALDMSEELSDNEQALLAAVDDPEAALEVLQEHDSREEPTIVEQAEHEAHEQRVETLEELMNQRLIEDKGLKEATVEAMAFEAKAAEFEDDDGEFSAETLVQQPESGTPDEDGDLDPEAEALAEEWGDGDPDEAIETLQARHENFDDMDWESHKNKTAEQLETLGVEV